jgi:hypothetical protein
MQGNITSQYDDITAYAYKYDLVLYKKITSPRFIDNVACENAQTIVRDGDVNKTNDLADFHTTAQGYTTANQKNLATQIHISSKQLLFLCNNPPTIEEVSWGAEFSVSDLDGANGYKIEGSTAADKLGDFNIEFAGDINDDGFDDFVITSTTSTSASTTSGAGYLIFGRTSNSDFTSLNVSSLNGINGVLFEGAGISTLGRQALYAGDINGDNIDDFMISTINGSQNGASSGSVYIIFGSSNAWGATFDLTTLDGSNGFRIDGNNANDELGRSIDYAGDINGDNISDIIISAYNTDKNGSNSGSVYIIFGKQQVWNATYDISDLADGLHGAELYGGAASNGLGSKIAGIGNFNNDKFADFIVTNLIQSGSPLYHYVVYGRSAGWTNGTDITTLSSTQATRFDSASVDNNNVNRVSGLGDINGDGINDISIGISAYGTAYAVFGQSASWGATVDLSSDLDGSNGFEINGESSGNTFPTSIKILQDVNNDDIDDILIGDQGEEAGYIIFGKNSAWSTTLDVSTLDGINGTKITGENVDDAFGDKVGTTGDINQDGINDVIISASKADPNGSSSGAGYVIFGKGKSYQIVDE